MPVSVLEAMSYGVPVITTPVGGIPEIIQNEHNGLLVTPGNHAELDQALKKLITKAELRQKMSANNLVDIQEFFPEKVIQQLQKLYEQILSDTCSKSEYGA
jgi:glycosyltransferase involved in cell wall biosynthesis